MSRIMSVFTGVLAIGLVSAPLVFAQGGTSATPTAGTTEVKAPATQATRAPAAKGKHAKHAMAEKIDLNGASVEQLEKLPGIDQAMAEKIVAGRPLKSKNDLVARGIVTKAEFSKISGQVFAKPAKAAK